MILGNAFGVPGITVDTHFQRLVRRWEWTAETDPVKIEHAVGALIEKRDWTMLSHRVIFHGRRVCHARKPACGACTLAPMCPSYGTGPTEPAAAAKLLKGPRAARARRRGRRRPGAGARAGRCGRGRAVSVGSRRSLPSPLVAAAAGAAAARRPAAAG